jgi:hypothetical protein
MPPLVAAASSARAAFHAVTIAVEHPSRKCVRTCARPVRSASAATVCRDSHRSVAGWGRRPPALHVYRPASATRDLVQRYRTAPPIAVLRPAHPRSDRWEDQGEREGHGGVGDGHGPSPECYNSPNRIGVRVAHLCLEQAALADRASAKPFCNPRCERKTCRDPGTTRSCREQ